MVQTELQTTSEQLASLRAKLQEAATSATAKVQRSASVEVRLACIESPTFYQLCIYLHAGCHICYSESAALCQCGGSQTYLYIMCIQRACDCTSGGGFRGSYIYIYIYVCIYRALCEHEIVTGIRSAVSC